MNRWRGIGCAAAIAVLMGGTVRAHEIGTTRVSVLVREGGAYEADIVSAYRLDRTGEGPRRAIYSFVYNGLLRYGLGMRLRDVNFAFKLCRRRIFDHIQLESEGSFVDAELLLRATRLGYRVIQFGVDYFPRTRGVSALSSMPVITHILREMFTLDRHLRKLGPLPAEELALPPPQR